ncbi:hypothetical protein CDD80_4131 [Ophiocordyceps camponoti-rufipedis]|uniref:Non-homologous end-joining factor 1 n=1 Tax=Ophiocordyceps camponoti-rufipedis TaxID=2004952 RepID=A0A2C5ZI07_9HYPO|nr:hypothetical protein CDD80_4131 [Ophiocordyceps camponoti-rufipedis]
MAATRDLAWRPLPLPASPVLPLLLVSARLGPASYVVRLSDMANLWEERLDRDDICARSLADNTSIDPGDTPGNMARFLACLASALDPLQPGHGSTSLGLTTADTRDQLTLTVTCPIAGFAPLKWAIRLAKRPSSAVATHLVLPLFHAQHAAKLQIESLLQALSQKDTVVAKLADKLEAGGTGLEQVFPALLGRKKVTRSAAEDKVKGLAPFDRHSWQAHNSLDVDAPQNTARLMQSVFGDLDLEPAGVDVQDSCAFDGWWRSFDALPRAAHRPQPAPRQVCPPLSGTKAPGEDVDDDFQVQATPPRLRAGDYVSPSPEPTGQDGAESLIPDSYPQAAASRSTHHAQPSEVALSGFGTIGGKSSTATAQAGARDTETTTGAVEPVVDDSETASEASDDDATASVAESPICPPSATLTGVKRGVMGSIGGIGAKQGGASNDDETHAELPSQPVSPNLARLGVIESHKSSSSKLARDDSKRGRHAKEEPHGGVARESSQERADRRREELKRELEKKAAAGPAKKKRRF